MSEYQYYEFRAINQDLSEEDMEYLRRYSTRAEITPTRFVNEYHFGDFKGNVDRWMEKYFDAALYMANWGSRHLMLRVPAKLLSLRDVEPYCAGESMTAQGEIGKCDYFIQA